MDEGIRGHARGALRSGGRTMQARAASVNREVAGHASVGRRCRHAGRSKRHSDHAGASVQLHRLRDPVALWKFGIIVHRFRVARGEGSQQTQWPPTAESAIRIEPRPSSRWRRSVKNARSCGPGCPIFSVKRSIQTACSSAVSAEGGISAASVFAIALPLRRPDASMARPMRSQCATWSAIDLP